MRSACSTPRTAKACPWPRCTRVLQRCLAKGDRDLARRFFKAAAKPTAAAWGLAAAADLAYPQAQGERTLQVRLSHRLEKPLLTAAETDIEVYSQVLKVSAFVDPPSSLLSPGFLLRLLRAALLPPNDNRRTSHGDRIE